MKYTQEQYNLIRDLVDIRLKDAEPSELIRYYRWFSLASNIHDDYLVKLIINDIAKELESKAD